MQLHKTNDPCQFLPRIGGSRFHPSAITSHTTTIHHGVESTSAIDTLLGQAQAIITRLDAAIQNKYSRDPDKLAAWKSASRTERPAKKAEAPVIPPPVN